SLRSVALTIDPSELWGDGIYEQSYIRALEAAGSIEVFGKSAQSANAIIEMHGNDIRSHARDRKHAFRVTFRDSFSRPPSLHADLFDQDPGPVNQLVFRPSWSISG